MKNFFGTFLAKKKRYQPIEPDEILLDSANLPKFDTARLEGRIERPLAARTFRTFLALSLCVGIVALGQLVYLQIFRYEALSARAEENRLAHSIIIAERGLILDRKGEVLAGNIAGEEPGLSKREYPLGPAAAHVVGYVSYPKRDQNGFWYQDQAEGVVGLEAVSDIELAGENGITISETDASSEVVSGSTVRMPKVGDDLVASLDAGLTEALYDAIATRSEASGWRGGAGIVMDVRTGELLALTSYPSFDPEL